MSNIQQANIPASTVTLLESAARTTTGGTTPSFTFNVITWADSN
jgi:hypothetical protein